jgi:hypothetical protein
MGACFSCIDSTLVRTVPQFDDRYKSRAETLLPLESMPHLLDLKLCEVSVMSSHNSYIRTLQHLGESSNEALQLVLDCGARCLELDIYRDKTGVFVAHGKEETPDDVITTTKLRLDSALKYLSENAFKRHNDPLFLALELLVHNEESACNQIADLLERYFGDRLFRTKGDDIANVRLRDLLGKVVLFSGGGAKGRLESIIHTQWSETFQNVSSETEPKSLRGADTCIRVYPAGTVASALSLNYNPIPFLINGATFVSMNMCMADSYMDLYTTWFARSRFVKKIARVASAASAVGSTEA